MAKKQLTPAEYKEKMEKKAIKAENFSKKFISALAFLMAVVITVGVVSTAFTYADKVMGVPANSQSTENAPSGDNLNNDNSLVLGDESTDMNDNGGSDMTTDGEADINTPDGSTPSTPADKGDNGAMTTAEIVEYFNKSANNVKKDATKVVKNYEKRIVRELKVPDVLQSTAESLIKTAMKDDTDPIVYDTKEDIRNNFLVPNQDYVSTLKPEYLEKASCKDNGKEYEIYFLLKEEENSVSGKGVGSVCDVIEAYEVQENAPDFLTKFSTYYFNCEVKATIDKSTGRLTHIIYSTPVNLDVSVDLFGKHDATVGFTFVKDYTISY